MTNRAQRRQRGQRGKVVTQEDPRAFIARATAAAEARRSEKAEAEAERQQRVAIIAARSRGLWLPGDD